MIAELVQRGLWPGRAIEPRPPVSCRSASLPAIEATPTISRARRRSCARAIRSPARSRRAISKGAACDVTDLPTCLRFHPTLWHSRTRENWPAMVAPLRDIRTNEIVGVHRTYLARDGRGKAPIEPPRMVLGRRKGACIKLDADEIVSHGLGIAEGLETALAVRARWLAADVGGLSAGRNRLSCAWGRRCLTIFADHDHTGLAAAQVCAERWQAAGREVFIRWPNGLGRDYADGAP